MPPPPAPAVEPPCDPLALGPDRGGFVRRVVDWPLLSGARPALLGGALARLPLPDAGQFRALAPQLLTGASPGEHGSPVVFLDVETTALDRGAGALAFMVGIAALVDGALRVEQWILTRLSAEAAMLAEVLARVGALAGPGAVLASFNGASFDVPLLRARLRRGGVEPAALERPHLDLLPPSRRMWRGRGPDCRLVTLERTQLGVRRVHDIAGHEIPAVFWAWLRRPEDPETRAVMGRVADHNLADLVTLPALAATIAGCLRAPADLDMAIRAAEHCLAGGRRGDALAVLETWLPAVRRGGGSPVQRRRALMLTADLLRRDLDARPGRARAAELWAEVCRISPGDPDAHEALAKHLEHHVGDLARALEVARASAAPCPRRLARLQRKLTGSRSVLVPLRSGHLCC